MSATDRKAKMEVGEASEMAMRSANRRARPDERLARVPATGSPPPVRVR